MKLIFQQVEQKYLTLVHICMMHVRSETDTSIGYCQIHLYDSLVCKGDQQSISKSIQVEIEPVKKNNKKKSYTRNQGTESSSGNAYISYICSAGLSDSKSRLYDTQTRKEIERRSFPGHSDPSCKLQQQETALGFLALQSRSATLVGNPRELMYCKVGFGRQQCPAIVIQEQETNDELCVQYRSSVLEQRWRSGGWRQLFLLGCINVKRRETPVVVVVRKVDDARRPAHVPLGVVSIAPPACCGVVRTQQY